MEGNAFKYAAFISYSHADEQWAKWLHQKLERYRVPSRLVGRQTSQGIVPRRIGRCFRDQAELSAASHLGEKLKQALAESRILIIICSPRSAKSYWVGEEIRYFRGLGRGDSIYALIVDGEPNSQDLEKECFPSALLRDDDGVVLSEPLAADARSARDGKVDSFLRLVAGIIGVNFDELRRREQRRRTRILVAAITASLVIATTTSLLAYSAYRARNAAYLARNEARLETERTRRTKEFFVSIFTNSNPMRRKDAAPVTVAGALDQALQEVETGLSNDPRLQGDLLTDFGEIRAGQGDPIAAKKLFQRAVAIQRKALAPDDPALGLSLLDLGVVEGYLGKPELGLPALQEAVSILRKYSDTEADNLSAAMNGIVVAMQASGDKDAAIAMLKEMIARDSEVPDDKKTQEKLEEHVAHLNNLGIFYFAAKRYPDAESTFSDCLYYSHQHFGDNSANSIGCLSGMTRTAEKKNDWKAANDYAERMLAVSRANFTGDHRLIALGMQELGEIRLKQNRRDEAEALFRDSAAMLERVGGDDDLRLSSLNELARLRLERGDAKAAMELADRGLTGCQQPVGEIASACKDLSATRAKIIASRDHR